MGGPSQSNLDTQNSIAQQQLNQSQVTNTESEADRAQRNALLQPAISFNQNLATGSPAAAMSSIAPEVTNLSTAAAGSKESIFENLPPGPARDVALQQLDQNTRTGVATAENTAYTGSFDKLANIGSGLGSFSLQELGASLTGSQAAASTNNTLIQAGEANKAATMGFLGELGGAAGQVGAAALGG